MSLLEVLLQTPLATDLSLSVAKCHRLGCFGARLNARVSADLERLQVSRAIVLAEMLCPGNRTILTVSQDVLLF